MFDIDEFLRIYHVGNLNHYFRRIKEADVQSLKNFKRKVIKHRKHSKKIQAFSDLKNYTVHDFLISAIKSELRKKSRFFNVYKRLIPLCRWILLKTGSKEITFTNESGLSSFCTGVNINFFFRPSKIVCSTLSSFWLRHWQFIITTVVATTVAIVLILTYLKDRT